MNDVHHNADLAEKLSDLLLQFSIETQRGYEQIFGVIEEGKRNELLEDAVYEEIVKTAKFEMAYIELVEKNCIDLSTRMQNYLFELSKIMKEYNKVSI